jgi:hypothetical protein
MSNVYNLFGDGRRPKASSAKVETSTKTSMETSVETPPAKGARPSYLYLNSAVLLLGLYLAEGNRAAAKELHICLRKTFNGEVGRIMVLVPGWMAQEAEKRVTGVQGLIDGSRAIREVSVAQGYF